MITADPRRIGLRDPADPRLIAYARTVRYRSVSVLRRNSLSVDALRRSRSFICRRRAAASAIVVLVLRRADALQSRGGPSHADCIA